MRTNSSYFAGFAREPATVTFLWQSQGQAGEWRSFRAEKGEFRRGPRKPEVG